MTDHLVSVSCDRRGTEQGVILRKGWEKNDLLRCHHIGGVLKGLETLRPRVEAEAMEIGKFTNSSCEL